MNADRLHGVVTVLICTEVVLAVAALVGALC